MGAHRHRDGGRRRAEELGQRRKGVRKQSALAPAYQGDNLYMLINCLFYKSEKILYFIQF